jgi:hypothetical protein
MEQERERAIQEQERTAQQRLGGSLLSAGGQILGTIMPAFAPAAGLATAAGQAIGGQPMLMGVEQQPEQPRRRRPGVIGGRMGSELIDPWSAQRGGY